jgi:hypothetical protein
MKKKSFIILLAVLLITIILFIFQPFNSSVQSERLQDLKGSVYFLERVDDVLTLFRSDATLRSKVLIYSHKGKGADGYGGYNDNLIDFHYDKESGTIQFIAMYEGDWSLFSLTEGEDKPILVQKDTMQMRTSYLRHSLDELTVLSDEGTLYLLEDGKKTILKEYEGKYDSKFSSGYTPIGFSPDGNYLVYSSADDANSLFGLISAFVDPSPEIYIMDLSTRESINFVEAHKIQWVMDE